MTGHAAHKDSSGYQSADLWVVKLDDTGRIIWQQTLGGSGSEQGTCVREAFDGSYIVAGFTNSDDGDVTKHYGSNSSNDAWAIKLTSTGSISWEHTFGGTHDDVFNSVVQNFDGNYIFAGTTFSNDNDVSGIHLDTAAAITSDIWVVNLDSNGKLNWQHCYGEPAMKLEMP